MNIKIVGENKKSVNDFQSLVKRTNKENPKPEDLRELRKAFDDDPTLALQIGNFNRIVFDSILEQFAGASAFGREAAHRHIGNMRIELGFNSSTFVEKMLIDEILMRWLRLSAMENDHKSATCKEHRFAEGMYYEKRLHLAQKRYLHSIETLAKVRKMIAQTQAKGAEMFKNLMFDASDK